MRFAGVISIRPILLPLVVLIPLTLVPTLLGYTGLTYAVAALFLNASFLYWTVRLILE
jgi:heme O synthase-like polyprenyltransferase